MNFNAYFTEKLHSSPDYKLINNIYRQAGLYSNTQEQTKDSFGYKWNREETYSSDIVMEKTSKWLTDRYLNGDSALIHNYLFEGCDVLDAGCGAALSAGLLFSDVFEFINYLGVDISNAIDVAQRRLNNLFPNAKQLAFLQNDLLSLPFEQPVFDVIFSEGVLHHTDSVEDSIKYLTALLKAGGHLMFYVYKKKAPVREFCDDYIREQLKGMSDADAWAALEPLTLLGKTLGDLNIEIDIPADIPYLEIKQGKVNLQLFVYWHIMKMYYRQEFSIDEMNHINYDWYRPLNCYRHTPEEIEKFCIDSGLNIERMKTEEAGITVIARKNLGA